MAVPPDYTFDLLVIILYHSLSIISIFFSLFLISVFIFYKDFRTLSFELICYLSISLIITSISYLFNYMRIADDPPNTSNFFCNFQSILMTIGELGQFIWTLVISISLYQNVVLVNAIKRKESDDSSFTYNDTKFRVISLICGFGIPVIIAVAFLLSDIYGKSNHWCWMASEIQYDNFPKPKNISLVRIFGGAYYGIIWALMLSNYVLLIKTISELRKNNEETEYINHYIIKLVQFPLILMLVVFPQTISKFLITQGYEGFYIPSISVCLMSIQGVVYTLSYGFNQSIRQKFKELIYLLFCFCCSKSVSDIDHDSKNSINTLGEGRETRLKLETNHTPSSFEKEDVNSTYSPPYDEKLLNKDFSLKNNIKEQEDSYTSNKKNEDLIRYEFK